MAVRASDLFLADRGHMYIFYLFLFMLVILHKLLFLGYITAGGDFGPSIGHRDGACANSHLLHFFDHILNVPVLGAVTAAVVVVSRYHSRGHFRA